MADVRQIDFAAVVFPGKRRVHWARTHLSYWSWVGTVSTTLCGRTGELGTILKGTGPGRPWCKRCDRALVAEFHERGLA